MAIDETGLVNGDCYTFLINKKAKGKKRAISAMVKGTKSQIVSEAILKAVPFKTLLNIKEITMDLSNSMDWIAPQGLKTYDLSMYFRNCYEQKDDHMFSEWIKKAEASKIKEMRVAANTVKSHFPGISNYFRNKATNANIESFNAKLKLFRRNTRGIKHKDFFFFRIFNYFA